MKKKAKRRPRFPWRECQERMHVLAKSLGRPVQPKDIVLDARSHKDSPWHSWFQWNVKRAAWQHWLHQARQLVSRLRVIYHDTQGNAVRAREYVRVVMKEPATHTLRAGYIPRMRAISTSDLRLQLVERAIKDVEQIKVRYVGVPEVEVAYPHLDLAMMLIQKSLRARKRAYRKTSD